MHLYQRAYKGADGERKRARTWWLVAHVGGERIHVSTRSRDRRAAELVAADIVRKAELKRAGVVDPFEDHAATPLGRHMDDFLATLRGRHVVPKYVRDRKDSLEASRMPAAGARRTSPSSPPPRSSPSSRPADSRRGR